MSRRLVASWLACLGLVLPVAADGPTAAERGRNALLEQAFIPPAWSAAAYPIAGRFWPGGAPSDPGAYDRAFMERYGLHPAPYANGRYPMGLREASFLGMRGVANDCLLCHGGSIAGQSYVGLGNTALDFQALFEDLNRADGRRPRTPFPFSHVRGTTEAGSMAVYLLSYREPDLTVLRRHDLGLRENLCEDTPAWWLLKKKRTMYHTGSAGARSVRSLMQFMLSPLNTRATVEDAEPAFADIQAYIRSLEPPPYPFRIDRPLAAKGDALFRANCARCHGTYGPGGTYPNRIIPIDVIGTDRTRFEGFTPRAAAYYNQSWFARERPGWLADDYPAVATAGYQAPPLDGIWATAPYFHNGSVPTVHDVLKSSTRPHTFTRSYRTGRDDYDPVKLGFRIQELDHGADSSLPPFEQRKIYNTTLPGRGNAGHLFGDALTEEERLAIIEYLKTI